MAQQDILDNWEEENNLKSPYAFINKTSTGTLYYFGDPLYLDYSMDKDTAIQRWDTVSKNKLPFEKISVEIFGDSQDFDFPIHHRLHEIVQKANQYDPTNPTKNISFDMLDEKEYEKYLKTLNKVIEENYEDVSEDFMDYLREIAMYGNISDRLLATWKEIIKYVQVLKDNKTNNIAFFIREIIGTKEKLPDNIEVDYLLMKEYLDGYHAFRPYVYQNEHEEQPGQTKQLHGDLGNVYGSYSPTLRYLMYGDSEFFKRTGRAYTSWQHDLTKRRGHMTFFTACRRMGKTMYLAGEAAKEMIGDPRAKYTGMRPKRVLYISGSNAILESAKDYILSITSKLRDQGVIHWAKEEGRLTYIQKKGKNKVEVLGIIDFISARSYEPGVGAYADLIIMDECRMIKEIVFENIIPIVINEKARLLAGTTLGWQDNTNHWFYKMLVKGEKEEMKRIGINEYILSKRKKAGLHNVKEEKEVDLKGLEEIRSEIMNERYYVGIRYTDDDNELLEENERLDLRQKARDTMSYDRFLAEYFSIYPEENVIFNYKASILPLSQHTKNFKPRFLVLSYDPAKVNDDGLLTISTFDVEKSKYLVLKQYVLSKFKYRTQVDDINDIIQECVLEYGEGTKILIAMDLTGVGQAVKEIMEMKGIPPVFTMTTTAGHSLKEFGKEHHNIGKTLFIEMIKEIMDEGHIMILEENRDLFIQFDSFKEVITTTGQASYEGVNEKDDRVSSFMIGIYYMHYVMGMRYNTYKDKYERALENLQHLSNEDRLKIHVENKKKQEQLELQQKRRMLQKEYHKRFVY